MTLQDHQTKQKEIINKMVDQIKNDSLNVSTVSPVEDFENDPRVCLTSVHFPDKQLRDEIKNITNPLRKIEPNFFFYPDDSLHITVKNIRVVNYPPNFTEEDIKKAKKVFSEVIARHKQFKVYFYRLILFPNNLALVGTTDPELDDIIGDLNKALDEINLADDKIYFNSKYFFCNMTLARFNKEISQEFREKVNEISETLKFEPYKIDSVTLLTCNSVFMRRNIVDTWQLD